MSNDTEQYFSDNLPACMEELSSLIPEIEESARPFVTSLCTQYESKGYLSSKQLPYAYKYWVQHRVVTGTVAGGQVEYRKILPTDHEAPRVSIDPSPMLLLLDTAFAFAQHNERANNKLWKHPKITYQLLHTIGNIHDLRFYITGAHSQNPSSLGCHTGDGDHWQGLVFVTRDGRTQWGKPCFGHPDLQALIKKVAENPLQELAGNGKVTGTCCFCAKHLTHPNSVHHGYGPWCAGKYGLPWSGPTEEAQAIDLGLSTDDDIPF